jgi:chitin synthase
MAASSSSNPSLRQGDLIELVSSSGSATVYPSDDAVLSTLHSRFRADLPYARIGTAHLVALNPYKALANTNDASAKDYEDRCYKDTALALPGSQPPLPPHIYELAAQLYLVMRRKREVQSVTFRCVFLFRPSPAPRPCAGHGARQGAAALRTP